MIFSTGHTCFLTAVFFFCYLSFIFTLIFSMHRCLSGGRANRPWGTIRRCKSSWRTLRLVWEIAVRRSSQVQSKSWLQFSHCPKIRKMLKLMPSFPFPPSDLMTEMMDMSSDLVGSGIPFLDYRAYAERIFFPGHQDSPLRRDLDVPESRRQTVEQGLVQLSNLLNSKLFLTKVN